MPKFDTIVDTKPNTASYTTTPKLLAAAQRNIDIAREHGMTLGEVFKHDHHDDGVVIGESSYIVSDDTLYTTTGEVFHDGLKIVILLDFTLMVRQDSNL